MPSAGDPPATEPEVAVVEHPAARSLAVKPEMLKPLDTVASSGIPTPGALSRELLNIVSKLSPPAIR